MSSNKYTAEMLNVVDLSRLQLPETLYEIEKRPTMWLAEPTVVCVSSFIRGWVNGRRDKEGDQMMSNFDSFVVKKYGLETTTIGWCAIINERADRGKSLDLFFMLFKEFRVEI